MKPSVSDDLQSLNEEVKEMERLIPREVIKDGHIFKDNWKSQLQQMPSNKTTYWIDLYGPFGLQRVKLLK